jgi:hypothetical protein
LPRLIFNSLLLFTVFLSLSLSIGTTPLANGAGETFKLSISPARTTEGNSTGVSLVVSVTNAMTTITYSFTWTVKDPSGTSTIATKSVLSTVSSWSLVAKYPSDFSGSLNLTGTYTVNVAEDLPSVNASIATGQFQVGLTDSVSYQRTLTVRVFGSGYLPSDNVTIVLLRGVTVVPGFPTWKLADTGGRVSFSWQTIPSTLTGTYAVSLTGKNTPAKTPPDLQGFTINIANMSITPLWESTSILQRTQMVEFRFNATYPNTQVANVGSALVKLTEPDGTTIHVIPASYDNTVNGFRAFYITSLSSTGGVWTASLAAGSFDDGFGNLGPATTSSVSFTVRGALLTVTIDGFNGPYSVGNTIPIGVKVVTPAGGNYTAGKVNATLTYSGGYVTAPLILVYDQTRGKWTGSYRVNSTDPSGTWLLTVSAGDGYGNGGSSNASFNVSVNSSGPGTTPGGTSIATGWLPWVVLLVALSLGFGTLISRHFSATHREVKLDVQAIKEKAAQVKGEDFLQSIQAQLKRRAERLAAEKEQHD